MTDESVSPAVLGFVDQHLDLVEDEVDGLESRKVIRREAPIIVFCETFFQQFFDVEFGHEMTSIDESEKEAAVRLRKKEDVPEQVVHLVTSFELLCDIWPDILGFTYDPEASSEQESFHYTYLPRVLDRIEEWATLRHYEELRERVQRTLQRYHEVVGVR